MSVEGMQYQSKSYYCKPVLTTSVNSRYNADEERSLLTILLG